MSPQSLIESYGYLAVFVGALLEGETVLAMGGYAAQVGYLQLPLVILTALAGGFLGDQLYFFLGRRHGRALLARFPMLSERAAKVDELLLRYDAMLIIAIRFMYGFRIAGPIIFGMGRVPAARFAIFNFIGACIWAVLVASIGFVLGQTIELVLADHKRFELAVFAVIALAGVVLWAVYRFRR